MIRSNFEVIFRVRKRFPYEWLIQDRVVKPYRFVMFTRETKLRNELFKLRKYVCY